MATTVESLRKAVGKKKNSRVFAWLADLMRQNGDLEAALSCVREGLSATPCEEGNLVLSKILVEMQDWDGVIEACEFVLSRNPYCLSAIRRLGDAYAEKGDAEKRNLYYRLLHDLDPLDAFWKEEYAPKIEMAEEMPVLEDLPESAPAVAPEPLPEEPIEQEAPVVSEEDKKEEEKNEDPFSSLATLLPADEENESEVSFDDLENSLDKAIADFSPSNTEKDEFPTEEIDDDDISTALSGIFGSAETEEPAAEKQEKKNEPSPEEKVEDKPQSLSDAFDSLFGEDELPEEFVLSKPSDKESPALEKEDSPSEELPQSLPAVESPSSESLSSAEAPTSEASSLFTKSSETAETSNPESSLEKSVESSFDSLFGDDSDDLPLESLGGDQKPSTATSSHVGPSVEVSQPEEKEDSLPAEPSSSAEAPASESSPLFTKSSETAETSNPESSLEKSVESSFDSLFGDDSDDLPLESLGGDQKPSTATSAHIEPSVEVSQPEEKEDSLPAVESPSSESLSSAEAPASESSPLFTKSSETAETSKPESSLEKSVESSFDSLFGDDTDDALVEDPTTSTRTLAEIYFEQGVYDEAIKIYKDLLRKSPGDDALKKRLSEIEKIRDDKKEN